MDIAAYLLRALRPYPLARFLAFLKKHRFNSIVNSPPWEDNSFVAKGRPTFINRRLRVGHFRCDLSP